MSFCVAAPSSGEVYMWEFILFVESHRHAQIVLPKERMSTPGTAAISAMLSMQEAVSTCKATMPLLLKLPAYPSSPARFMLRCGK